MGGRGVEHTRKITPRESGLTSVWSCITRDLGEPFGGEKADDGSGDTDWYTLRPDNGVEAPSAYGEGRVRRVGHGMTAFRKERLQGLSGMQGNLHVPFLGG